MLGAVFFSCEKNDIIPETVSFNEEDFNSTTGNHDQILEEKKNKILRPVLHMSFGKEISEKEADLQWESAVIDYIKKNPVQNKVSSEWFFKIITTTGDQTNNNTFNDVQFSATFNTDVGSIPAYGVLEDAGNVRGQTDRYLFRGTYPGQVVSWVEAESATLSLQGTDGWLVTKFKVKIKRVDQTASATGFSSVVTFPNVILDNIDPQNWDIFETGNIGTGRLEF